MLQAVGFALRYLPLIVAAVQFVQNFAKADASKEARKNLAVQFVVDTLQGLKVPVTDRTIEIIESLINLAVTVLNAFGIFEHDKGPLPAAIAVASEEVKEIKAASNPSGDTQRLDELEALMKVK